MALLAKTLTPVLKRAVLINGRAACRMYNFDYKNYRFPHMNDLYVPEGSWEENYRQNQKKYNLHLALGVGWLIFTISVFKWSGLYFFNFFPPDRPGPKVTYDDYLKKD